MRSLSTAQEQFKAQCVVDQDGDGVGEYGWLGELSGVQAVRGTGQRFNASPFIAAILGVRDARGISQKSGYMFALYLRGANGRWRREPVPPNGAPAAAAIGDADAQEAEWRCYAWPNTRGPSGTRAFMVDQTGNVFASPNTAPGQLYSGTTRIPGPNAAFTANSQQVALSAIGLTAQDGGTWVPAGN